MSKPTPEERAAEAAALADAAKLQREYERKRAVLMDEAVLITVMLRQRLPVQHPPAITDSDMLLATVTVFNALYRNAREELHAQGTP